MSRRMVSNDLPTLTIDAVEEALVALHCVLMDPKRCLPAVSKVLGRGDVLPKREHQEVWRAMLALRERTEAIAVLNFIGNGKDASQAVRDVISRCLDSLVTSPSPSVAAAAAKRVVEAYKSRINAEALQRAARRSTTDEMPVVITELLSELKRTGAVKQNGSGLSLVRFGDTEADEDASIESESQPLLLQAPTSDLGNAQRLKERHGERIRFCLKQGWFRWNGKLWESDPGPFVRELAGETARTLLQAAVRVPNPNLKQDLVKWALKSENSYGMRMAVQAAETFPELQIRPDDLDADPFILNAKNGVVDLRTGEITPHDPKRLCTKIAGANYDPSATCPRFERFLREIFTEGEDDSEGREMIAFVQRFFGYCANGSTKEQVFGIAWGSGANGKSVLLETIKRVLGGYAITAPMSLWMESKDRANTNSPDLARLQGARFVTSSESDAGRRLNEGLLKSVTGTERITATPKYRDPFEFSPVATVVFATNHRPQIMGTDDAIWRRVCLIPFRQTFPPNKRDLNLYETLAGEADGILRWLVEGHQLYQKQGLQPPQTISSAVSEYRKTSDRLRTWIDERCEEGAEHFAPGDELFEDYKAWSLDNDFETPAKQQFWSGLTERGFRGEKIGGQRQRVGLRLKGNPRKPLSGSDSEQ